MENIGITGDWITCQTLYCTVVNIIVEILPLVYILPIAIYGIYNTGQLRPAWCLRGPYCDTTCMSAIHTTSCKIAIRALCSLKGS